MQVLPRIITLRWRAPAILATALLVAGLFPLANVALAAVTVTAATGGGAISADTRSPSATPPGSGAWTSLTGPTIAEGVDGDLVNGTIVLTLPAGFEYNTAVGSVTPSGTGCTASARTYTATTVSTTIATSTNLCTFTYSGLQVRPTTNGAALSSGSILGSGTAIPPNVNYGTLTEVAGAATKLAFTTPPGGGTGGIAWTTTQPVVTVQDQFGNTVTTSTASITLAIGTNPSGGTLTCTTNPLAAVAGVATFAGCKIDKAGTGYTLTASSTGLTPATSATFSIIVGPAAQLAFTAYPASPTVTTLAPQPAVTVQDAGGNTVTSDNATAITLAIGTNPAAGTLACTGGLSKTVTAGIASFAGCTINNPGTGYTLTADDGVGGLALITGVAFNVAAGPATQLAFTTQPGGGTGGLAWATQPVVQVRDQFSNTVGSDNATVVTLAISGGTPATGGPGTLTCTGGLSKTVTAGVATFAGCKIDKAGTGYTLTATSSPVLTAATSATFNITVGPAAQLAFTAYPASPTGTTLTPQPAVAVQDAGGNTVTSDNATAITLAIGTNPAAGTLACTGGLLKTVTAGVASFAGCTINNPGTGYTLTADDGAGGLALITGAAFDVVAGAATKLAFTTQPGGGTVGTAWASQPVVTVQDQFGNTVTTDNATVVTLAITSPVLGGGTLSCTGGLSKIVTAGVASFTGCKLDAPVVGYRLTATSVPVRTPATSNAFDVAPRPADRLGFLAQPSAAAADVPFSVQPVVAVQDAVGGTIRSGSWATAMITLSLGTNPSGGTLSCTGGTSKAAAAGVATFTGCKIDKPGVGYTLVASVAGLTPATSAPFEVTTPAAQVVLSSSESTIIWGNSVSLSVAVSPNGGDRSVVLESSPDGFSWSGLAPLTTDSSGNASLLYRPATNLYYRAVFAGAPDLSAGTSNTTRTVVRQIALLRPTNGGLIRSIARNTSITFTTTVRPSRPELPPARVTFRFFRLSGGSWTLVTARDVVIDTLGKAATTFKFTSGGSWYVRTIANPTSYNANSVWSPVERYNVR